MASTGAGKAAYAQTIDYDGDGQRDLLVANSETANWQILSFKPSTYQHTVCEPNGRGTQLCEDVERVVNYTLKDLGLKAIGLEGKALVADVNGDALEDIIFIDGGAIKWYRNLGNGSFAAAQSLYSFPSTEVGTTPAFTSGIPVEVLAAPLWISTVMDSPTLCWRLESGKLCVSPVAAK